MCCCSSAAAAFPLEKLNEINERCGIAFKIMDKIFFFFKQMWVDGNGKKLSLWTFDFLMSCYGI